MPPFQSLRGGATPILTRQEQMRAAPQTRLQTSLCMMRKGGHRVTTTALHTIRSCIARDLEDEPQSVIKVDELRTLRTDVTQYVLTDQLAREYARVFERVIEAARPAGNKITDVGVWLSGFFGSGKSLFAKLAGHVLADTDLGADTARSLFQRHLRRGRPGDDRLAELFQEATNYRLGATLVAFDIMAQHTAAADRNVGLTFLRTFYHSLGLSTIIPIAQAELELQRAGKYEDFKALYVSRGDQVPWEQDRDITTSISLFAECLTELLPQRFSSATLAAQSLEFGLRHSESQMGIEDVINLLLRWLDEQQQRVGNQRTLHLLFVADEVGAWAGRNLERIEQLRAFVEALGRLGQGRIWLLVTSQEKLSDVVADQEQSRANARLLERLEARFKVNVHLDSSEVSTVIADRVLLKQATAHEPLVALWKQSQQTLLDIAARPSLEMGGTYPRPECDPFVVDYPFLPYQLPAAADLFGRMRGVKVSSGARSMIKVAFDATRAVAEKRLGALIPWDQIFDSANTGNEFADEQYLGSLGLEHIRQADRDVSGTPILASRVLKVLWLMQHNPNVPRTPANLARLLVENLDTDVLTLETQVRETLEALEACNFVRHDPATEQWKHLSLDEVTVEQMLTRIQADLREREVQQAIIKLYEDRLNRSFTGRITVGQTNSAFNYAVTLNGEGVKGEGEPVELRVWLPDPALEKRVSAENTANLDAPVVQWMLAEARRLKERMRRVLAIERLPNDEQYRQSATDRTREHARQLEEEAGQLKHAAEAEVEHAFAGGALYYAGNTIPLDSLSGGSTARSEIEQALRDRVQTVYTRFSEADKRFRADNIDKLFTVPPAERAALDTSLGLFTPDGHVRGNHLLVEPVVHYLQSSSRTSGQEVMDAFARVPYGWPGDLLRYVAAALFVDGKVASSDRTGKRYDDPRAPGARQLFGTQAFKTTRLEVEEDALTPDEVSVARDLLRELKKPAIDGTEVALKEATLQLCADLTKRATVLDRARDVTLPLPPRYAPIPEIIREVEEAGSRVKVVRALLAHATELRVADTDLRRLEEFSQNFGLEQYRRTLQLLAAAEAAGLEQLTGDGGSGQAEVTPGQVRDGGSDYIATTVATAREQLEHLITERRVLEEWKGAFHHHRLQLLDAFKAAYVPLRERLMKETEAARRSILEMPEFSALSHQHQTEVRAKFLDRGAPLQELPAVTLHEDAQVLKANEAFSIAHLRTALGGIDAQVQQAKGLVLSLYTKEQRERGEKERTVTWQPAKAFAGKRFKTVPELEAAIATFMEQLEVLKRQIQEGKEIQVL